MNASTNINPYICQRATITGRVQGVGYRYWMQQTATQFAVTGWVRNTREGTVDAVVCGTPAAVDGLLNACRQGPRFSSVSSVTIASHPDESFAGFETRSTV